MEFEIIDLIKYYFKHFILSFLVFVFSLLIGLFCIFNIYEKEYVGKTTFMLGVCIEECDENYIDIYFNNEVVNDYIELATSNLVLSKANEKANLEYSNGLLREMVNVTYEEDTGYVVISVTSNNKYDAAELSYNIYEVLIDEVYRIFEVDNIHLVDTCEKGSLKYSNFKLVLIAIIISLIISGIVMTTKFLFFSNKKNKKNNNIKLEKKTSKKENTKKTTIKSNKTSSKK